MGIVYEAVQESLERHVALKILPESGLLREKPLKRFRREALAAARLHHTNIVPIYGVGQEQGLHYLVMQFIDGLGLDECLAELRREVSPPGWPEYASDGYWKFVARLGAQAARALAAAHEEGTLHRDIKPGNLLLDETGHVWVSDFGLAKLSGVEDLTEAGQYVGTLRYLAPEALDGQTSEASDIYSLAATLYELVTLKPCYSSRDRTALVKDIAEAPPAPARKRDSRVPVGLDRILNMALAARPGDRYVSAISFAEDLEAFLDNEPIRARRETTLRRALRFYQKNRALAAGLSIAVFSLATAAIVLSISLASVVREKDRADRNVNLSLTSFKELFESFSNPFGAPIELAEAEDVTTSPARQNPRRAQVREQANVLGRLLEFYEKFASENATNPDLRFEAAGAYLRACAINLQAVDQEEAAQKAYQRAVSILEDLSSRYRVPRFFHQLLWSRGAVGSFSPPLDPEEQRRLAEQVLSRIPATLTGEALSLLKLRAGYELARCTYALDQSRALPTLRRVSKLLEELDEVDPYLSGEVALMLGEVLLEAGETWEAHEHAQRANALLAAPHRRLRSRPLRLVDLPALWARLSQLYRSVGDESAADEIDESLSRTRRWRRRFER